MFAFSSFSYLLNRLLCITSILENLLWDLVMTSQSDTPFRMKHKKIHYLLSFSLSCVSVLFTLRTAAACWCWWSIKERKGSVWLSMLKVKHLYSTSISNNVCNMNDNYVCNWLSGCDKLLHHGLHLSLIFESINLALHFFIFSLDPTKSFLQLFIFTWKLQ